MKKHQTFHPSMGPSPFRLMGSLAILFCLITSSSATLPLTDSGGAFAQTKGFSITPPINTVYFGMQVNAAGDLNNDGIDDIVIGARNSLNFSFNPAFVLFGRLDGFSEDIDLMTTDLATTKQGFRITSSTDWQWFAVTQANGGDVNGDGIADILFGAGSGTKFNAMCIVILGGKDRNSDINLETTNLVASGQGFAIGANIPGNSGGSVSTTGDINNDGINDILIVNHGTNAAGYVWFGRKGEPANVDLVDLDLDTSQQGFQITLTAGASSQFGHASGCVGDLNHDGIDDFAIGAHGSGAVGVVYVFFGKEGVFSDINLDSTSLAGTGQGFKVIGATTTGQVGWSISTAIPLDYNNDGIDDLFFGAPGENAVYVVFGKTTGFTDINLATTSLSANKLGFKITGASGDQLGSSVSPVGDVNGDLIEDILIGSSKSGMTYVVYGREGDPEDIDLTKISLSATSKGYAVTKDGVKTGFSFGGAVSYAGDLNRDGVNDLIIGAPQTTPVFSASYPGKVYTTITSAELIIAQVVKVATTIYEIIAVVSCSICVNSSFVITFGVMSKLVQVIRYLDLPYPYQLLEVLRNSNGELMNLNLPADVENQLEMKQIEAIFGETSVANSFLSNTWGMLIVLASLLGSWMLCKLTYYLLQRVKRLKGHFILSIIKVLCKTSLSFFIIQLYENLGEITFYSVIEFKSVTFSTPLSNFSFVLSIIFVFLGLTILILHGRFLYRYKSVRLQHKDSSKEIEEFVAKNDYLRLLYDEFVDTAIHKQAYPFILALLDILIFFTVSLLVPYPLLESIILLCCALFLCVYLIWRRPYKERFDQFTQIFLELCVLIVFGCVVIFAATCGSVKAARNNKYDAQRLALGVIYMIIIIKVSSSLFMGIKIIEQIRGGYKAYSQRKRSKIQAAPSINILKKIPIKSMDDKGELSDSSLTINSFSPPGKASSRILSKNLSNQLYVKPSLDHESSLNTTQNTPHPDTTRGALLVNFKEKMAVGSESTLLSRFSSEKSKLLQKSKENPSDTPTSSIIMAQEQGPSTTKPQTIQRLEFGSKRSYQGLGEKAPAITLKSNSNVTTQHKLAKGK